MTHLELLTATITLRRAAEQARSAIRGFYNKYSDEAVHEDAGRALAALDAALAEPDAKPVHPGYIIGSHWLETAYSRIAAGEVEADVLTEVLGARGWVKPEPATMEQIIAARRATDGAPWLDQFDRAWKAAERFHGIRKEDK